MSAFIAPFGEVRFTPLANRFPVWAAAATAAGLEDFGGFPCPPRAGWGHHGRQTRAPFWPRFELRESADAYEVHGGMPGLTKDDIEIELVDDQTLAVRGRKEGPTSTDKAAGKTDDANTTAQPAEASAPSQKATVEDELDEEWSLGTPEGSPTVGRSSPELAAPAAASADAPAAAPVDTDARKNKDKKESEGRGTSRHFTSGTFNSVFNLDHRVDRNAIEASLKDGLLKIRAPKAQKQQPSRITIS